MVRAAVVNIFDQSMGILLVLYAITTDRCGIAAVSTVSSSTMGKVQLRKSFHWRISMQFRVNKYFATKPDSIA